MGSQDVQCLLRQQLVEAYQVHPDQIQIVWAPYRICPLGAHIDHQLGTVTAMAIDRGVMLAFVSTDKPEVRLRSLQYSGETKFFLNAIPKSQHGDWGNYARGAASVLQANMPLARGIVGITSGELAEIGLSSSASIGLAYLLALEQANHWEVSDSRNILFDQAIENEYLGLNNGILDQSAILLSLRDQLTVIDCREFAVTGRNAANAFPPPGISRIRPGKSMPAFAVLIAASGITQTVVSTGYNQRVAECTEAARLLLKASGSRGCSPVLGHVTSNDYEAHKSKLPEILARRARHFFSEMQRVWDGISAWTNGDLITFAQLMTASGESSIHNYECGSPPMVDLFRLLMRTPGVYGARFSGAGFRGCCVALVDRSAVEPRLPALRQSYAQAYPKLADRARFFLCGTDDGARPL